MRLRRGTLDGRKPTYGPNGREIALVKHPTATGGTIWISSVDGSTLRQLTTKRPDEARQAAGNDPAWSPDGSWIAFASGRAGIWLVRPDGSDLTQLTTDPQDGQPAWSPNGAQIAFVSNRAGRGTRSIWIMNVDGSGQRRVTGGPCCQNYASFSPDGPEIVFTQGVYESRGAGSSYVGNNLMIITTDGTGLRQLTTGAFEDTGPSWGTRGIVFESNRLGSWGIKMIQPDGSDLQAIPNAIGRRPTWSPDGTRIAFEGTYGIYEFNFLECAVKSLTQLNVADLVIYIKPGVANSINPKTDGSISVAILSTPWLDPVRQIDRPSITFGPTGDERSVMSCAEEDVNQDGISDLVCRFDVAGTFLPVHTQGILKANGIDGSLLEGRDALRILTAP